MKPFTEDEKEVINQKLKEVGLKLFTRYGIKKTSIRDITAAVGIGKSTFYTFYKSKEELYMTIFKEEGTVWLNQLLDSTFRADISAKEAITRFVKSIIQELESNLVYRTLLSNNDIEELYKHLSSEDIEAKRQSSLRLIIPHLIDYQQSNEIIDKDPELLASMIRSIVFLYLHRTDIGDSIFDDVIDLLLDLVTSGISINTKEV